MRIEPVTTIKVPKTLRERISREAAQQGLTAAGLISELLDEHERQARFRAVRRAYENPDSDYLEETEVWDTLGRDGLDP
jgi:hypothetical protein